MLLSHSTDKAQHCLRNTINFLEDHLLFEVANFLDFQDAKKELVSPTRSIGVQGCILIELVSSHIALRNLVKV